MCNIIYPNDIDVWTEYNLNIQTVCVSTRNHCMRLIGETNKYTFICIHYIVYIIFNSD